MKRSDMIKSLRKTDLWIVATCGLGLFCFLMMLYKLIPPEEKNAAKVLLFFSVFMLTNAVFHLLHSARELHKMRLYVDRNVDLLADEVMHVETIREKLKEELGNAAIDNTVHGAFFYARQQILAKDGDVTCMRADFDDREFDMALIVKRKSTPIDEVLSAVNKSKSL